MARYTPLHATIWTNPDFVALEPRAQLTYLLVISQADVSFAGVGAYTPARWARMSANTTAAEIERAVSILEAARFVFVDRETEEIMVRSFVKHGKIYEQKQLRGALKRAYESVLSTALRRAFHAEQSDEVKALVGSPPEASSEMAGRLAAGSGTKALDLDLEPVPTPAAAQEPDADDRVEAETARRVESRRRRGQEIGPKLEALIRSDVVRDLAVQGSAEPARPSPLDETAAAAAKLREDGMRQVDALREVPMDPDAAGRMRGLRAGLHSTKEAM